MPLPTRLSQPHAACRCFRLGFIPTAAAAEEICFLRPFQVRRAQAGEVITIHILVDEVASVAAEVSALLLKPIPSPFSPLSLFFLSRRRPDLLGVIGQDESR